MFSQNIKLPIVNKFNLMNICKINNLLNAFGNEKIWIQNNHMYQKIGRMIQFGVTWGFTN